MREGPGCLETRAFRILGAKGVVVIPKQDAPGQSRSRKVVPAIQQCPVLTQGSPLVSQSSMALMDMAIRCLFGKTREMAPICPPMWGCDAAACPQAPASAAPLSGLVVHLCGGCGYVGTAEREPDPPPPKWLRPTRGVRISLFRAGTRERQ